MKLKLYRITFEDGSIDFIATPYSQAFKDYVTFLSERKEIFEAGEVQPEEIFNSDNRRMFLSNVPSA